MKKIIISLFALAAGFAALSCTPDVVEELNGGAVPMASELDVTISVDQETNYVTFTMNTLGVAPIWIFSESDISTRNGLERRFRSAGTYTVEVKAMNRNGISDGSVTETFVVNNDYVVPSHPLFGTGSKRWKIAAGELGHMGLGPAIGDISWWAAPPYDKAAFGMYDDIVTFTGDGKYTYDPGPDGMTYVRGTSSFNDGTHKEDFDYPSVLETTTYELNDEETQLTLPVGTFLPWIASDAQLASSVYTIYELNDDRLILAWQVDAEAWQIILQPVDVIEKHPLFGTGSKVWKVASGTYGHLGCGPETNPTEWWGAGANEKADFGIYDDRVTFTEDGGYKYDPGLDGLTFVNKGTHWNTEGLTDDFDIPGAAQESTYTLNGDETELSFPADTFLPYIADDAQLARPVFEITELTSTKLQLVWHTEGISWQFIFEPADAPAPPPPFNPGSELDKSEFGEMLAGSWTWESDSAGHIGCGENIWNPTGWWNGAPNDKANASMYDDVITFGPGSSYKFDPVDGMTYMNKGVTLFDGVKVDIPYVDNAETGEGDWRIEAAIQESTYTFNAGGETPSFTLPAGIYFSYIPADVVFYGTIVYYITAMWENQIEISAECPGIAWRYRLKRVL